MAGEPTSAERLLLQKLSVPSDLRTAEWARVPQWIRERSFYMAGVHRAEILDEYREAARKIVAGEAGIYETETQLQAALDRVGYTPEPGQEGTIKDLRSVRRMQTALRTNVQLLQGWSQKERGLAAQISVPAWELVRFENRMQKRRWQERWMKAGGVLREGRMIALKADGIWLVLGSLFPDSLGVDYPPFAWGSGMGWQGVTRRECIRLGIIAADWKPEARLPVSSPSENLSIVPKVSAKEIREELTDNLSGLARWEGKRLVFTDPNGTRPAAAEEIAKMWETPLPEIFHTRYEDGNDEGLFQRLAMKRWIADPDAFEALANRLTGLDLADDLWRLQRRLPLVKGGHDVTALIDALGVRLGAKEITLKVRGGAVLRLFRKAGRWIMKGGRK